MEPGIGHNSSPRRMSLKIIETVNGVHDRLSVHLVRRRYGTVRYNDVWIINDNVFLAAAGSPATHEIIVAQVEFL